MKNCIKLHTRGLRLQEQGTELPSILNFFIFSSVLSEISVWGNGCIHAGSLRPGQTWFFCSVSETLHGTIHNFNFFFFKLTINKKNQKWQQVAIKIHSASITLCSVCVNNSSSLFPGLIRTTDVSTTGQSMVLTPGGWVQSTSTWVGLYSPCGSLPTLNSLTVKARKQF